MSKMQLPTLKTVTYNPATQTPAQSTGPVVVAPVEDPDAAEDAQRDKSVAVQEGEVVEGMTAEVVTSVEEMERQHKLTASTDVTKLGQSTTQSPAADANMPRWGTPTLQLAPRLAADDVAKLEELSRTLLEVRSIAVAAQTSIATYRVEIDHLVSTLKLHFDVLVKDEWKLVRDHIADEHAHACDLDDEVAMLRSRLDAVDTLLTSRGLPTTATAAQKPTLKLHARRRMVYPAQLVGDAVVLYYNPRQGHDGNDNQEFTLSKDNVRNVWTGYAVEVPTGYVCDVFIDADVLCSKTGKDEAEFVLKATTRGPLKTVSSGGEVCRLSLRKVEPMRLEVVKE